MKALSLLVIVSAVFAAPAWSDDWRCVSRQTVAGVERCCYDADTIRYNAKTDRVMVWFRRDGASGDEKSHIEIGCTARLYRVLEEPRDFFGRRSETGSLMGNWKEIEPESEFDFVKKAVCKEPSRP